MKKAVLLTISLILSLPALAGGGRGSHGGGGSRAGAYHAAKPATGTGAKAQREQVGSYTRKSGTRVTAHDRSTKDTTKTNNWSTKGNSNPETGKSGTK